MIPDEREREKLIERLMDILSATAALTQNTDEFERSMRSIRSVLRVARLYPAETGRDLSDAESGLLLEVLGLLPS